jgi:hypothetical protein
MLSVFFADYLYLHINKYIYSLNTEPILCCLFDAERMFLKVFQAGLKLEVFYKFLVKENVLGNEKKVTAGIFTTFNDGGGGGGSGQIGKATLASEQSYAPEELNRCSEALNPLLVNFFARVKSFVASLLKCFLS